MGIRKPEASDFEVRRFETFIEVTFRPTRSIYTFTVQKGHGKSHATLSSGYARHAGRTGHTTEYASTAVHAMARRLAEQELTKRK
jgi:hypothetical protein